MVESLYFKNLAENIPHILFIVDPENYRIQYINKLQPGYTLEKVIGIDMFTMVLPEHIEIYKLKLKEVKETQLPAVIEIVGESSSYANGKAWYRTQISVIKDSTNTISSLMFLSEDITIYKQNEIENINQTERIKAIVNNTTDIICSIDLNFNLTEFNSVFATLVKRGYGIEMQIGVPVFNFIDPTKHSHLMGIYNKVLLGESLSDIEKFDTVNGTVVYNETSYHPIYNANKKIAGISIFSKDITERVKNDQKIKNALKEKEVLLAEIHHRIKNNLAMISSLLQLQEMNINNEEAKEALRISRKRIKSTALIHELLYKSESLDVINLKEYLSELFNLLSMNKNVQLKLEGDDVTLDLLSAMPLGLMMNEIILNSFKHSYKDAPEGRTEIKILVDAKLLTIDYCDCKGVFPEAIDFKNSNTTGLMLIHTFAEQLSGNIDLISKSPPKYKIQVPLNDN